MPLVPWPASGNTHYPVLGGSVPAPYAALPKSPSPHAAFVTLMGLKAPSCGQLQRILALNPFSTSLSNRNK
jgi:hypothetical protein